MSRLNRMACVALFLFSVTSLAYAHKVICIADGDTMTVLVDRKPVKLCLANTDAPEKAQAFGQKSKQSLSDLCWGKDAQYDAQPIDRYGRAVAIVRCAGIEVNRAQVERGIAWVYALVAERCVEEHVGQDAQAFRDDLNHAARNRSGV